MTKEKGKFSARSTQCVIMHISGLCMGDLHQLVPFNLKTHTI